MPRWKTTLLLLAVTIGIGTYIAVYEIKQPTPQEQRDLAQQILDLPTDQATQIILDLPQVQTTLVKQDATWRVLPQDVRADPAGVSQLLYQLSPLSAVRTLTSTPEQPLDAATYGLAPALGQLSVTAAGRLTTVLFGQATPVQSNRYFKIADRPEIFVISEKLFAQANRAVEQWRDPFLLRFDPWTMQEFTFSTPQHTVALTHQEHAWVLTQPVRDQADVSVVNELLSALERVSISRFLDDHPQVEQLASFGFDQPYAQIRIQQTASQVVTLFIGNALPDDTARRYAKRSDEPALYVVLVAEVDAALTTPEKVRAMHCVDFRSNTIRGASITAGGKSWTMEREQMTWRATGTDTVLPNERVDAWLQKLLELRILRFVDDAPDDVARYGLQAPEGMITISTNDGRPMQRLFIGSHPEGSLDRYARIEGRDAVVILPAVVSELLAITPEQLTTPSPAPPASS